MYTTCEHMVDMCPYVSSCDEWLLGDKKASVEFETNPSVSVCATCFGCVGVHVWSKEMVDGHGEGQVETYPADGLGVVMDGHEAWTDEPTSWPKDWLWVVV
jgi:hypothetical protein